MEEQPACIVVLEACGGAHYWARELEGQGHQAKLIAPQYVKPFVKRQKNDAADAEAIVIAAQRPEMRFVEAKDNEQIARGVVFRARDRLVRQRTEQINALRSVLYEQGQVFPKGAYQMKKIAEFLEQPDNGLLGLIREECEELLSSISDLTTRIDATTLKLKKLSKQSEISRRLQTIPGVGPLTAMAVEAFAPPMDIFRCGRDFAAWLGLVPKQHSSGGKERLGKVSKEGMVEGLQGKLLGDKGYISEALFERLWHNGLHLITGIRKNMKNHLMPILDKLLLRKRFIVETLFDWLKSDMGLEHTRHRSPTNALVHILSCLAAYALSENKVRMTDVAYTQLGQSTECCGAIDCSLNRKTGLSLRASYAD